MKKNHSIVKALSIVMVLLTIVTAFASCDGGDGNGESNKYYITLEGVKLTPDMDMAPALEAITETPKLDESAACPPFEGIHILYEFASVKISTYPQDGKNLIMGIFLKDESLDVMGVTIGSTVEDMEEKLGKDYEQMNTQLFVYNCADGSRAKFIVRDGKIASIHLLSKMAND